jgi:hypothetical protein
MLCHGAPYKAVWAHTFVTNTAFRGKARSHRTQHEAAREAKRNLVEVKALERQNQAEPSL